MRAGILGLPLMMLLGSAFVAAQERPEYTFGTTVVDPGGLQGQVYALKSNTQALPDFRRMRPMGTIYTRSLNIWPQFFDAGFPGITDRFEWFAISYSGRLWLEHGGTYRFSLLSDDGSRLKLNHRVIIDLDGQHQARAATASATLSRGVYDIEIEYFQGPRITVALVLAIAPPGEAWRVLNTGDFKPPQDPRDWWPGRLSDVQPQTQ